MKHAKQRRTWLKYMHTSQWSEEKLRLGSILETHEYKLQATCILTTVYTPTARHRVSAITEEPHRACYLSKAQRKLFVLTTSETQKLFNFLIWCIYIFRVNLIRNSNFFPPKYLELGVCIRYVFCVRYALTTNVLLGRVKNFHHFRHTML